MMHLTIHEELLPTTEEMLALCEDFDAERHLVDHLRREHLELSSAKVSERASRRARRIENAIVFLDSLAKYKQEGGGEL